MAPRVTPLTSITLDSTRVFLALAVAVGHWTQHYFQAGWPDLTDAGVAAVGGFFVLSGFTIRMLTPPGESFDMPAFFIERLSRLWSVVLPAVALTAVLDGVARAIDASYYMENWGANTSHPLFRILASVFFLNELWGRDVKLFSNALFWSVAYEMGFYLIYGLAKGCHGVARYAFPLLACLFLGPNIVFMFVPWLLGALTHDVLDAIGKSKTSSRTLAVVSGGALVALAGAAVVFGPALMAGGSVMMWNFTSGLFGLIDRATAPFLFGIHVGTGRIDGRLMMGALFFLVFFVPVVILARAVDALTVVPQPIVKVFRRLGDFTFPLYLFHFPIFVVIGALAFYDRESSLQKIALFLAVCLVIYGSVRYANALKFALRRGLTSAFDWAFARWGKSTSARRA